MLKEILGTLKVFGQKVDQQFEKVDQRFEAIDRRFEKVDQRFDEMNDKMDQGFANVNQRLDRLEKKSDGMRVELTETQETTNFLLKKIARYDEKSLELRQQPI